MIDFAAAQPGQFVEQLHFPRSGEIAQTVIAEREAHLFERKSWFICQGD
jgi:hypothetical protein